MFLIYWFWIPLSVIFQLLSSVSFIGGVPRETYEPATGYWQILLHKVVHYIEYTLTWADIKLAAAVVMGTECIGRYKSNYYSNHRK